WADNQRHVGLVTRDCALAKRLTKSAVVNIPLGVQLIDCWPACFVPKHYLVAERAPLRRGSWYAAVGPARTAAGEVTVVAPIGQALPVGIPSKRQLQPPRASHR